MESIIEEVKSVVHDIFKCRKCGFHKDLDVDLRPWLPVVPYTEKMFDNYHTMVIGLNPGWNEKYYEKLKRLYPNYDKSNNFNKFIEEQRNISLKPGNYERNLAYLYNVINSKLRLNDCEITSQNIYDYVFWANLSFCASNNPEQREIKGINYTCRVLTEEIFNCLHEGFLYRLICAFKPELIICFTQSFLYFKTVLDLIFDYNYTIIHGPKEKPFTAYTQRNNQNVRINITGAIIKINEPSKYSTKVIFCPHPNRPCKKDNKISAISKMCDFLTQ